MSDLKGRWFKLEVATHKWWHWIIRPIKTYRLKKYLKSLESCLHEKLDQEAIDKCLVDNALFGYSVLNYDLIFWNRRCP